MITPCLSQVMLINAVKDVTSALGDLMQATKSASGKNMQHPAMHQLKDGAKVGINRTTIFWVNNNKKGVNFVI